MNTFLFTCLYINLHIYRHPWDVWPGLNVLSGSNLWTCLSSPLPFFSPFLFIIIFLRTTSPREMAFYCDCATTNLGGCLFSPNWNQEKKKKMIKTSVGLFKSFNSDCKEEWKHASGLLKKKKQTFLMIWWFVVTKMWNMSGLWIGRIFLLSNLKQRSHEIRMVDSARCYNWKKLDF